MVLFRLTHKLYRREKRTLFPQILAEEISAVEISSAKN